jgi:FdhD protein
MGMDGQTVKALRFEGGAVSSCEDALTVEEPLQITLNGEPHSITMRTPGSDDVLVRGLLFTEGVVRTGGGACVIRLTPARADGTAAVAAVEIPAIYLCDRPHERRALLASAACGMCGQREFDERAWVAPPLGPAEPLPLARVAAMMASMREGQATFTRTGSTHAAAVFDVNGERVCLFEDIGRHNAVDKAVGFLLLNDQLPCAHALVVSGRISYEIVYKAYRAGIAFLLAVSAPSSLAVAASRRWGMTLVGYCRDTRATVYTHDEQTVR